MNTHKNARLSFAGRVALIESLLAGEPASSAAHRLGVSRRTVAKWVARYRAEGVPGLADRSSRPRHSPRRVPRYRERQIRRRRRQRWSSLRIAQYYGLPVSTVVTVQRRLGLARLHRLEPPRPILRYEHARPGALLHVDSKKLGRITRIGHRIHGNRRLRGRRAGWEYLHVAIDDCTRLAYAEVLAADTGVATSGFLQRALAWYRGLGIHVRAVLSDNAKCYTSHAAQAVLAEARLRHCTTRPYRPQTNGKAERLIRTLLHEWAYSQAYRTSTFRTAALPGYLRFYNTERRHSALQFTTPAQRLLEKL